VAHIHFSMPTFHLLARQGEDRPTVDQRTVPSTPHNHGPVKPLDTCGMEVLASGILQKAPMCCSGEMLRM